MKMHAVICPICDKQHIDNCEGCIRGNELVCGHFGTKYECKDGVPDVIELDEYDLRWEEIK